MSPPASASLSLSDESRVYQTSVFYSDIGSFALGLLSWVEMTLIGRLYLGELLLAFCSVGLPVLFFRLQARGERTWLGWFLALAALYLLTLVATDLYRGNQPGDYLRGWARAGIYLTNLAGLLVVGYGRVRRLVLFFVGGALSQLGLIAIGSWPSDWKFGFALPISILVLSFLNSKRRVWALSILFALGLVQILEDYRSFGAFFFITALLVYAKGSNPRFRLRFSSVLLSAVAVLAFGIAYQLTSQKTIGNIDLALRRGRSNTGRLAGLIVGYRYIRASPLVGYGSWARSDEALEGWALLQAALGSDEPPREIEQQALESPEGNEIRTHSMFLQAWVEAGVVGAIFFGFTMWMVVALLYRLVAARPLSRYFALGCFLGLWSVWAFLMSPFAGESRLYAAMSMAALFSLNRDEPP
jgi:O-antigen ligase